MWSWILVQWAQADEESECGVEAAAATVAWSTPEGGELVVTGAVGVAWTVQVEARFGSSSHRWEVPAVAADETGVARLPVSAPAEARLDALASSYVTDLSIRVVGTHPDGSSSLLVAPAGFLAWDASGAATVWSEAGLARHAPHGVTDAASVPAGVPEDARVLPPVYRVVTLPQEVSR